MGILLTLLVIVAVLAILWWGYTQISPNLPRPFQIIAVVVIVIVACWLLLTLVGGLGAGLGSGLRLGRVC